MDMRTMTTCFVGRWSSGDDLISDDSWQTNKQVSSQRMVSVQCQAQHVATDVVDVSNTSQTTLGHPQDVLRILTLTEDRKSVGKC